jgi:hypothetical protein
MCIAALIGAAARSAPMMVRNYFTNLLPVILSKFP